MKKKLSFILALTMVFAIFASCSTTAFADSIINRIITPPSDDVADSNFYSYEEEIKAIDTKNKVQLPKKTSYLSIPEYMYVDSNKGNSAFVFTEPDSDSSTQFPAYHGTRVKVLAVEGDWACIVYRSEIFKQYVGWVSVDMLSSNYPCEIITFGDSLLKTGDTFLMIEPEQNWSNFNFYESDTKYLDIDVPYFDEGSCVGLTIEYIIMARNGVKAAWGERTVYTNDGKGWLPVGTFDVNKDLDPVRIQINYDEPKEIKAVAIIPTDPVHEECEIIMSVSDMIFPYDMG